MLKMKPLMPGANFMTDTSPLFTNHGSNERS